MSKILSKSLSRLFPYTSPENTFMNEKISGKPYTSLSASGSDSDSIDESLEPFIHLQPRPTSRSSVRYIVALFLLLNIAGLAALYFAQNKPPNVHIIGRGMFPPVRRADLPSSESEARPRNRSRLAAALPKGAGFLIVEEPERYDLPPGVAYKDAHKRYGVTWAHQYHCIWMLRTEFWLLVQNNSTIAGADLDNHDEGSAYLWHLAHCFGYLRQTITCNMDMTIEYPTLGGSNEGHVNGYEVPHQCVRREPWDEFMTVHAPKPEEVAKQESILQAKKKGHQHMGRRDGYEDAMERRRGWNLTTSAATYESRYER